jgi:chemotaxis response regulator CheB
MPLQAASQAAGPVDTGMVPDGADAANGITSANLLTASKDEDLVF